MSYGTVYTLPFKSIKGKDYLIKIEREGYAGAATELKGQRSPFTVSVDGEDGFIYQPARFSTATLSIFGGDYLQDLFSTDYRMHRVTLYEGGVAAWCGFIKPEMYTQDYRSVKFPLDLECYSAMSVLEYIDYKQQGDTRGFVSLWDLLKHCISESRGQYTAVYLPHVYGKDKTAFEAWENPLSQMSVSEQNFFDEDDEPMKLKEVLEEIMKLLNWTCADWQGELYFTDADNEDGDYYKYNPALTEYTKAKANSVTVQEAGFAGADHTLDIVPGYNKVTVRCSNYPVGDALPELSFDDMETIGEQVNDRDFPVGQISKTVTLRPAEYSKIRMNAFRWKRYGTDNSLTPLDIEEEKKLYKESPNEIVGAVPEQYDTIEKDEDGKPERTDYELKERIRIDLASIEFGNPGATIPTFTKFVYRGRSNTELIRINGVTASYRGGAFSISFKMSMSISFSQLGGDTLNSYDFHFRLKIGNTYYHGNSNGNYYWDTNSEEVAEYSNNLEMDWEDEAMKGSGKASKFNDTYSLITSRELGDGFDGMDGFIIKLPEDRILSGELELVIFAPDIVMEYAKSPSSITLTDFSFTYQDKKKEGDDSDRIYENIVNENYINELDKIEFKISSYNNDGSCHSKVLLGKNYLEDNLYCGITGGNIRPEELLIRRIIDHYSATKIKLTQVLKKAAIKPFTILSDKYMDDKKFMNIGGEIDYKMNRFTCIMLEI